MRHDQLRLPLLLEKIKNGEITIYQPNKTFKILNGVRLFNAVAAQLPVRGLLAWITNSTSAPQPVVPGVEIPTVTRCVVAGREELFWLTESLRYDEIAYHVNKGCFEYTAGSGRGKWRAECRGEEIGTFLRVSTLLDRYAMREWEKEFVWGRGLDEIERRRLSNRIQGVVDALTDCRVPITEFVCRDQDNVKLLLD